jgi:hypothetical protein
VRKVGDKVDRRVKRGRAERTGTRGRFADKKGMGNKVDKRVKRGRAGGVPNLP